jgi:pyridoxal phosphate-dependent aminotransferase EpsN
MADGMTSAEVADVAEPPTERLYLSVPHMGGRELEYVRQAFESNWLSTVGPQIDAFEEAMAARLGAGVKTVAVTSGTAALHLVLRAIGVGPEDRVAVSTLTFAGSVFPILYLGAQPVFIDSEAQSWNIDPNLVEDYFRSTSAGGTLPKALIVVHLYGQHADLDPLAELCERYGVTLVEDAAESLGATYRGRQTATTADYSILSFNGNKMITTSGGGMVVTRDERVATKVRKWANQSREPAVEYLHEELGYNYRMSNVLAAIGRGQLEVLDERVARRRAVAERYRAALERAGGLTLQPEAPWGTHSRWLSVFALPDGAEPLRLVADLAADNIEARPMWRPMHTQPLFKESSAIGGKVAERLFARGICLPSSSSLANVDQGRVIDALTRSIDAQRRVMRGAESAGS